MAYETEIVQRARPGTHCEVCQTDSKNCTVTSDGMHMCRGRSGPVPGWEYRGQAQGDTQWGLYRRPGPGPDFAAFVAKHQADLGPEALASLSADLGGVPIDGLTAVGYGFDKAKRVYTAPWFDGLDAVTGVAVRKPDGKKLSVKGTKLGLAQPTGLHNRPGPLFVVEGHSDTAALWAAGLKVVGRPSNQGGVEQLIGLAGRLPTNEAIVAVVENDQKADGQWPGRDGSLKVARQIARRTGRRVLVAQVPDGAKDVRAWLTRSAWKDMPWAERGRQLAAKLAEVDEEVAPPTPARAFQVGDRVTPNDRGNVGTVVEDLGGGSYKVEFVGKEGMAEKDFAAADLEPFTGKGGKGKAPPRPPGPTPPWRPFPLECLPKVLREFVQAVAAALGADPAMVAVPALAAIAGAIGNSRVVKIKVGWLEAMVLWAAVIAEPGGKKSPALRFVFAPVWDRQHDLQQAFEAALACWRKAKAAAKQAKDGEDCPAPGPTPQLRHVVVDDITVEALAQLLADNPRGLICVVDELRKWVASFDRYRGGKGGSDRPFWLSAHDAQPTKVDRKSLDRPSITVRRGAVSLCGGVQPAVWRQAVCDAEADDDGLAARLLHCLPPDPAVGWTDAVAGPEVTDPYAARLRRLYDLDLDGDDPVEVALAEDALLPFQALCNAVADGQGLADDWERPVLAKTPKHAARLAGVLQLFDYPDAKAVSGPWMKSGIALAEWFRDEAFRVRCVLGADPEEARLDRLEQAADRNGGRLAPRDLVRANSRRFPDVAAATTALNALVSRRCHAWGWVEVSPGPEGGRPSRFAQRVGKAQNCPPEGPEAPDKTDKTPDPSPGPGPGGGSVGFVGRILKGDSDSPAVDQPAPVRRVTL